MNISHNLTKHDGSPLNPNPVALTTRLAEVFRRPDDKMASFMGEVRALNDDDKADFKRWFAELGLTCV